MLFPGTIFVSEHFAAQGIGVITSLQSEVLRQTAQLYTLTRRLVNLAMLYPIWGGERLNSK